jgi:uncharacterized phage infection (PIP) family protein YhgE
MAENRTTYTTIIDTQVNGAEQIEDLGDKAGQTDGKFKALRSQIRETNVQLQKLADEGKSGTAEFEKLRAKLDELNDAQDRVNFQAGQFDDQLSALPGPIGQVGGAIRGFNEGLNKFSTGFKLALGAITLIIAAIAAFREALKLCGSPDVESQYRLQKWLATPRTNVENWAWSVWGAEDAVEYYDSVSGDFEQLRNSYDWNWLASYAFIRRNLTPDL